MSKVIRNTMELLKENEIISIAKQCGFTKVLDWYIEEFSDTIIGYLGDHLKLIINVESEDVQSQISLFVKCMPRFDKLKAKYLRELRFFQKEYIMLSQLFKEFNNNDSQKWHPKSYLINKEIFVFEDVTKIGYAMPHHQKAMTYPELKATIKTLARFHAQSYIYEEKKTKQVKQDYRIWDEFNQYLQEPSSGLSWRDTGRNAVIDFLKVYSRHKDQPNFSRNLEKIIPKLFDGALGLMSPSSKYRNVVIHRDLWTNNILLKHEHDKYHALIVDYQTVLYCSPMLDLCSLIYFNTSLKCRDDFSNDFIDCYYDTLSRELSLEGINVSDIWTRTAIFEAYKESVLFGITQAALIVPIVAMSSKMREQIFCDPENGMKANVVSRSEYFINIAEEDEEYCNRVIELFDEIVERYCIH